MTVRVDARALVDYWIEHDGESVVDCSTMEMYRGEESTYAKGLWWVRN